MSGVHALLDVALNCPLIFAMLRIADGLPIILWKFVHKPYLEDQR